MTDQLMDHKKLTPGLGRAHFFQRFTGAQRWEHTVLLLCVLVLLLTGLPQKYRATEWSQFILSTPERVDKIQQIHHTVAIFLTLLVVYHLGRAFYLLAKRSLPGDMLPVWQDVVDAGQMIKYLLFINKEKPLFGKYNFEQKFTYWFVFFGISILVVSGFIIWFPVAFTRILPGEIVPAAKLAHSTEALVAGIFIIIWHFYHVHVERLNMSIFTGRLNEEDMQEYHPLEYERLTTNSPETDTAKNS